MRLTTGIGAAAILLQFGLQACTPSTNVPGTDLYIEAADGKYHGPMESIAIEPDGASIEVSVAQPLTAVGIFEDGTRVDVTRDVYWEVEDSSLVQMPEGFEDGALVVTGKAEGTTTFKIRIGTLRGSGTLTVVPASLTELAIQTEADTTELGRGSVISFTAMGTYRDGTTADLTESATWTSSDEAVMTKIAAGWKAVEVGQATLTVTVEGVSSTLDVTVVCKYPADAPRFINHYETLPYLRWDAAVDENGNTQVFDLEEVMCNAEWARYDTLGIIVSTEWCPYCPDRMRWMNSMQSELDGLGMKLIYAEVQDRQGRATMDSAKAAAYVDTIIPGGVGLRIGDLDSTPTRNIFNSSDAFINAFPTVFVVRTRDMKIIANQTDGTALLDLPGIAANPEWNWRDPDNPIESFVSNCGDRPDESYEPNDTMAEAPEVGALAVEGGICAEGPDFYRVNIQGNWRVTLLFDHDVGDLDVYVWNEFQNAPLRQNNRDVGSYTTNNNESFEHSGPALIRIEGKRNDSAPYTLYIEAI